MLKVKKLLLKMLMLSVLFMPGFVSAELYAVVINSSNAYAETGAKAKQQVRRLFLKNSKKWPGGTNAKPFSRKPNSKEEAAFASAVLNMSSAEIAQHWISKKQTTGDTPPRKIGSFRSALKVIGKYPGAFVVLKKSEIKSLPDNVKILFTFGK